MKFGKNEICFGTRAPRSISYVSIQTGRRYIQFNWWKFSLFIGRHIETILRHVGCGGEIISREGFYQSRMFHCTSCGERVWGAMIEEIDL